MIKITIIRSTLRTGAKLWQEGQWFYFFSYHVSAFTTLCDYGHHLPSNHKPQHTKYVQQTHQEPVHEEFCQSRWLKTGFPVSTGFVKYTSIHRFRKPLYARRKMNISLSMVLVQWAREETWHGKWWHDSMAERSQYSHDLVQGEMVKMEGKLSET